MYPHFIEVTCELGDEEHRTIEKRIINVDHIVAVSENIIHSGKDGTWYADESYDDLKKLIVDCGCLIQKADPRLDTSHPLTMDDLREMVGEPVWNSNLNVWLLVKACSDLYVDLVWTTGNVSAWDADEIQKFPLYRMKQDDRPLRERLVDTLREVRGEK